MAALWSNLEVNIGIICSCLPTLKTCVMRYFPKIFSSSSRGTSSGRGIVTIGGRATGPGTGRKQKRDSVGLNFLSRGNKTAEVYDGTNADLEDVGGGTQIRPGSAMAMDKDEDGIQVVTVVHQDTTTLARGNSHRSDTESTRKLVRETESRI